METDRQARSSWSAAQAFLADLNVAVQDATLERDRAWVIMRQAAPSRHLSPEHPVADSRWGSVALTMARHERASNDYQAAVNDLIHVSWWYAAAAERRLYGVLAGEAVTVPDDLTDKRLRSQIGEPQHWSQGLGSLVQHWKSAHPEDPRSDSLNPEAVFTTDKLSSSETFERFTYWGNLMIDTTRMIIAGSSKSDHWM